MIHDNFHMPIIYPVHPRTVRRIEEFGFIVNPAIQLIDPTGYMDFLQLEANASLILTDSGGVQEEACILGIPCVTIRDNTERPETVDIGSNIIAGTDPDQLLYNVKIMINKEKDWENPYGDGKTSQKILKILLEKHRL